MKQVIKHLIFGKRVKQKKILFGLASGIKMNIDFSCKLQRYFGLDEREIQKLFKKNCINSTKFIDVGASDGYYGLAFYKRNKDATQYLLDADEKLKILQKDNFFINGFKTLNVNFISKLVGEITDEVNIAIDDLIDDKDKKIFIKIDVDGGETEVLKGMMRVLSENNCTLIVETHSSYLEKKCIEYLQGFGYKSIIIRNAWWRIFIPERRPIAHNRWFFSQKKLTANY